MHVITSSCAERGSTTTRGGARATGAGPKTVAAPSAPITPAARRRPGGEALGLPPPSAARALAALAMALSLTLSPVTATAAAGEVAGAAATTQPTPSSAQAAARAVSGALSRFLKSRHAADGGARLLGPVRASGDRLRQAADALLDAEAAAEQGAAASAKRGLRGAPPPVRAKKKEAAASTVLLPSRAYADVLRLVRAGSFECFSFDALDGGIALPGSLSAGGGARCTLQIVAREAVRSLGQDQAGLGQATADEADALARALQLLDDRLDRASEGDEGAAAGVAEAMERALRVQTAFQGLIERCLFE